MSSSIAPQTTARRGTGDLPSDETLFGIGLLGVGGLGLAAVHSLSGGALGIPCPLRVTTGLDCPACGATRMAAALLHGDLGAALQYNAPVLVGGLVVGYLWIAWLLQRFGLARLPRPRLGPRGKRLLLPIVVTVAIVFAVLRNLPWEPFTALYV